MTGGAAGAGGLKRFLVSQAWLAGGVYGLALVFFALPFVGGSPPSYSMFVVASAPASLACFLLAPAGLAVAEASTFVAAPLQWMLLAVLAGRGGWRRRLFVSWAVAHYLFVAVVVLTEYSSGWHVLRYEGPAVPAAAAWAALYVCGQVLLWWRFFTAPARRGAGTAGAVGAR
jgi:hypothetical protein